MRKLVVPAVIKLLDKGTQLYNTGDYAGAASDIDAGLSTQLLDQIYSSKVVRLGQ